MERKLILQAIYFKLRFSLSYHEVEELLSIRGVIVDDATMTDYTAADKSFNPSLLQNRQGRERDWVNH